MSRRGLDKTTAPALSASLGGFLSLVGKRKSPVNEVAHQLTVGRPSDLCMDPVSAH